MNGLTQDRVTRLSARRNSSRKAHHATVGIKGTSQQADPLPTNLGMGQPAEALARTVEREVIPRLIVAHRPHRTSLLCTGHASLVDESDVLEFTGLLANRDVAEALARIELKRERGISLESLYLDLLIPAARRLADLWEADQCHYDDIALGIMHLRQVLHELSPVFSVECERRCCNRKVLLLSAPGEQSMLGVFMVTEFYRCIASEFFYRAGWEVWRAPPTSRSQLSGILRSQWFDVIDVSASCEARLPLLSADLAEMRKTSCNSRVGMIVGGPVFRDHPELASSVGADASASDPRDALLQAEMLVGMREW